MIHLFINGLAASAGGGLTYLRNVIPHLARRADVETTVLLSPSLRAEFADLPRVSLAHASQTSGVIQRFIQEQTALPDLIRLSRAHVLISAGNFALRRSPIPQILLSRNSLYLSRDFFRDLRARGEYRMWLDTRLKGILARRSIVWADCTIAPSRAFADQLKSWTGRDVVALHHGFDQDIFRDSTPLPESAREELESAADSLRLLFVSHYNYYRNFETLLRALPPLKALLAPRKVRLLLTTSLSSADGYSSDQASALIQRLQIADDVVPLGAIPYRSLSNLYRSCDLYVTPAYAETFAHPLVEAMASGLPVVASDLDVHKEICENAALYFPRFSPDQLAQRVAEVASSSALTAQLAASGRQRAASFSWSDHVESIVALALRLAGQQASIAPGGSAGGPSITPSAPSLRS